MIHLPEDSPTFRNILRALVLVALVATSLAVVPFSAPQASAQESVALEVWGFTGGIVDSPQTWKFTQSNSAANDIGSATAAALSYDDSSWADVELPWDEIPGPNVANHFRKDFTLDEISLNGSPVELFQIEGIKVTTFYDDAAVMYLNGVEVYRSMRGNIDRDFSLHPASTDLPFDVNVSHGGFEIEHGNFIVIPDPNGTNDCEKFPGCTQSPYIGQAQNPPEIPKGLLRANGVNTFAVTTWNQSGGGSGDSVLNHAFELLIDPNAVPPNPVFINEVMAANETGYEPGLGYPDWIELINVSAQPVNLEGWSLADSSGAWIFPAVTIPANGYLVVAANNEDITGPPLQTNFRLSKLGDSLKLTNPDGIVADDYGLLPQQFDDNSFGRPSDTVIGVGEPTTYLAAATPGLANSAAGNGYAPILRPFANRLYNQGETVDHQVDAFDPDGDVLTYVLNNPPPGISIDSDGLITGTATTPGTYTTSITVTDSDGDSAQSPSVIWLIVPAATGSAPIVLNEYNAVAGDREFLSGGPLGNEGDWYEFVVVDDELDLRGYTFELWDMKASQDNLRLAATVTFGDDTRLARAPSGTIITFSQEHPDDLSFDAGTDWHINFGIDAGANGTFFETAGAQEIFNSTRSGQAVLIKNAAGEIVTPLSGETEAWDNANGGVSGAEVMSLCVDPTAGMTLNPVTDYSDNGASTSFGQPNTCVNPHPLLPTILVTFNQSLTVLRSSATLGAGSGDVNCDLRLSVSDALAAAQYAVGNRTDSGPCLFSGGGAGFDMDAAAADFTQNGRVSVQDALAIAQCSVGIPLVWCPDV